MLKNIPRIMRGRLAYVSLVVLQIFFVLDCILLLGIGIVGSLWLAFIAIFDPMGRYGYNFDQLFWIVLISPLLFLVQFAMLTMTCAVWCLLFPHGWPSPDDEWLDSRRKKSFSIACPSGHTFTVSRGRAGSMIPCPVCAQNVNVPALSVLDKE